MSLRHFLCVILAVAGTGLGAVVVLASPAWGDADPASDVLLGENVFYPYTPRVSANLQAGLNREVTAAHRARLPLKVALIAVPIDLGAIPNFFAKPRQYAAFLDQEISFGNGKVPLLVVMRNGYGWAGLTGPAAAALAALAPPAAGTPDALAQAAARAVRRLATASGHPLSVTAPGTGGGGGGAAVPVAILAGVCLVLAAGIIAWRRRTATRGELIRGGRRRR